MGKLLNCPNCGAPITAEKCDFCGTVFLDFAAIQVGAPSYVKFKIDDDYICARLVVTNLDIEQKCETVRRTDALGVTLRETITGWGGFKQGLEEGEKDPMFWFDEDGGFHARELTPDEIEGFRLCREIVARAFPGYFDEIEEENHAD